MFKKSSLFIILVMALLISGCADKAADVVSKVKNEATGSSSSGSSSKDEPLFKDEASLKQFEKDAKERIPELKLFRETFGGRIYVGKDYADFTAVDPKNPKNVDKYNWKRGSGFGEPKPVKVRISGEKSVDTFTEYQDSMAQVNFAAIPKFVEAAEKAAKDQGVEGAQPVGSVSVEFDNIRQGTDVIFSLTIKGTRTDIRVKGNSQTGEIISAKKSN